MQKPIAGPSLPSVASEISQPSVSSFAIYMYMGVSKLPHSTGKARMAPPTGHLKQLRNGLRPTCSAITAYKANLVSLRSCTCRAIELRNLT